MFYDLVRDPPAPAKPPFWPTVVNLFAWVLFGTAVCGWVLYFTDFFPQILALLSLGGILAWAAFLANLLTKERKEELQARFERYVLLSRKTPIFVCLAAILFFLGWAPRRGSLVVSTVRDDKERTIEIRSREKDDRWTRVNLEEEHLSPRSEHKYLLPTPWFCFREYRVKIGGLPARHTKIGAWQRRPLAVPSDFELGERPILLIRLSAVANGLVMDRKKPGKLLAFRDGKLLGSIVPYYGEAVWVGGDADIEIPERILTLWRLELVKRGVPTELLARWQPYRSLAPNTDLAARQHLKIQVVPPSNLPLEEEVTVGPPYPQEVYIDVPH